MKYIPDPRFYYLFLIILIHWHSGKKYNPAHA